MSRRWLSLVALLVAIAAGITQAAGVDAPIPLILLILAFVAGGLDAIAAGRRNREKPRSPT
jgi:hypothetical protein